MLFITAHIYGKNKIRGEFKSYEVKTLNIFKKYGGEIIAAYVPLLNKNGLEVPDEIHVLKISDQNAFDKFLNDPERLALSQERDLVIARTEVFISQEIVEY